MDSYPSVPLALTDERDRILISQTPLLPVPTFGPLPEAPFGRRQYVAAADGLYLQARHHALNVTAKLADASLPYGSITAGAHLPGGLIPYELMRQIAKAALTHHPHEWAGLVHWHETAHCYELIEPKVTSRSGGHVSYETDDCDPERIVLNVHSHGVHSPFFSPKDDVSDEAGCYFACVLGHCESAVSLRACLRLVVDGHVFAVSRPPWHTAPDRASGVATSDSGGKMVISLHSLGMLGSSDATDVSRSA